MHLKYKIGSLRGGHLRCSRAALGRSWGGLGRSRGGLRRSWEVARWFFTKVQKGQGAQRGLMSLKRQQWIRDSSDLDLNKALAYNGFQCPFFHQDFVFWQSSSVVRTIVDQFSVRMFGQNPVEIVIRPFKKAVESPLEGPHKPPSILCETSGNKSGRFLILAGLFAVSRFFPELSWIKRGRAATV